VALNPLVLQRGSVLHDHEGAVVHLDGAVHLAVVGHAFGRPSAQPFKISVLLVGERVPFLFEAVLVGEDHLLRLGDPRAHEYHRHVARAVLLIERFRPVVVAAHELPRMDPVLAAGCGEEVCVEELVDLR